MAYRDLREFVRKLEKEGELKRIREEVDPLLEITEVTQRIARDPRRGPNSVGPALLFEKPKGSRVPLLVNTFGSVRRMELAFEVGKLEEVADRIKGILAMESPQGLFDKLKKTVLRTEDEVLLTEAMIAVSFADGDDQWEESQLIKAFLQTLPELKDKDVYEI